MVRTAAREAYSYRTDAAVPSFDDAGPIAFMDGACGLCTRGALLIARFDRKGEFRICPIQSPLGRAVLVHYGLAPDDPESWLYLVDGEAYTSIDAMIRVAERIGGPGRVLGVARLLPRGVQDWIYRRIARNRFGVMGRAEMCAVPDPELRRRLIG